MIGDLGVFRKDNRYADLEEKVLEYEEIDFEKIIDKAGEEPQHRLTRKEKEEMLEARLEEELDPYKGSVPAYALERGLDLETCKVWELGHDTEKKRLVFPVRRARDKALVGLIGRTYIDEQPPYLNYFDFAKSKYLYGEWMVSETAERIIVVEGPIDAIACWKAGESAVGIMGAFASAEQTRKLEYYDKPIYMFPDDDGPGHKWANALGDDLRELGVRVRDVQVSKGADPSDLPPNEIRKMLRAAPMRI